MPQGSIDWVLAGIQTVNQCQIQNNTIWRNNLYWWISALSKHFLVYISIKSQHFEVYHNMVYFLSSANCMYDVHNKFVPQPVKLSAFDGVCQLLCFSSVLHYNSPDNH